MGASLRPITPIDLGETVPGGGVAARPECIEVDPSTLLVDETYQRHLSERGLRLIRKIVGDWDWRRFKPPIVARTAEGLQVIDGQHTATAAACHPAIATIPVMVIEAAAVETRAMAFVGHNKDRVQLTPCQVHHAALAAGDPESVRIQRVCAAAGVTVLKHQPGDSRFQPGDTMAVKLVGEVIQRRGEDMAQQILQVLVDAGCAPVGQAQIRAVELLLTSKEYAAVLKAESLAATIKELGDQAEREAGLFAATHNLPKWRALAVVLFKRTPHGRRARSS